MMVKDLGFKIQNSRAKFENFWTHTTKGSSIFTWQYNV